MRRFVGLLAAGLAALGVAVAPGVASADTLSTNPCVAGAPAQAAQPVTCIPVSVWVDAGVQQGAWLACGLLPNYRKPQDAEGNLTGQYHLYQVVSGYEYRDANGFLWYGWTAGGQAGPWYVTSTQNFPVCENY